MSNVYLISSNFEKFCTRKVIMRVWFLVKTVLVISFVKSELFYQQFTMSAFDRQFQHFSKFIHGTILNNWAYNAMWKPKFSPKCLVYHTIDRMWVLYISLHKLRSKHMSTINVKNSTPYIVLNNYRCNVFNSVISKN